MMKPIPPQHQLYLLSHGFQWKYLCETPPVLPEPILTPEDFPGEYRGEFSYSGHNNYRKFIGLRSDVRHYGTGKEKT